VAWLRIRPFSDLEVSLATAAAFPGGSSPVHPVQQVLQLSMGYMLSSALHVAVRLGIADHLVGGPRDVGDLARELGVNEDALYRVLRALAGSGVFHENADRQFGLTPSAEVLRSDAYGSVRNLALWLSDPFHFRVYADADHSLATGRPALDKTMGLPLYDHLAGDQERSGVFNDAMTNFSAIAMPMVLMAYDFSGIEVLVDVAGGHGEVLTSILAGYPEMRGVLMDVEHVIAGARERIARIGMSDRCQAVVGDLFGELPRGDAYVLKHIVHGWDDEQAVTLLRNIRKAMGETRGKVILLEALVLPANQPDLAKTIDLEMLMLAGGRERTVRQYRDLFERAGFTLSRLAPTMPLAVIEAQASS